MPCKGKQNTVGIKGSRDCIEKMVGGCSFPDTPAAQGRGNIDRQATEVGATIPPIRHIRLGLDKGGILELSRTEQ